MVGVSLNISEMCHCKFTLNFVYHGNYVEKMTTDLLFPPRSILYIMLYIRLVTFLFLRFDFLRLSEANGDIAKTRDVYEVRTPSSFVFRSSFVPLISTYRLMLLFFISVQLILNLVCIFYCFYY